MKNNTLLQSAIDSFWNGNGFSIDSEEGREAAIERAIKDLMHRTLTPRENVTDDFKKQVINTMLKRLHVLFSSRTEKIDQDFFDSWHHESCIAVQKVLQSFYLNKDGTDVAYGKAQKIVNMTMKGLRCLKNAENKQEYFRHCHMALDFFTLEWFKRYFVENSKELRISKIDAWSFLQYLDGPEYVRKIGSAQKEFYTYNEIISQIRIYRNTNSSWSDYTLLEAEFIIWPQMQLELAAEALYGQAFGSDAAVTYMLEYLEKTEDPMNWLPKINDAKDKFKQCKILFRKLTVAEKLTFLHERIKHMQQLFPVAK